MKRSLGYLEDKPDARDRRFGTRFHGDVPDGPISLLQYRERRLEQDGVSACVGFALARAIHVSLLAAGYGDAPEPSPLFLYFNARRAEHAGEDPNVDRQVRDEGCYPRLAMQAVRNLGFCKEGDWPFIPSRRNTEPRLRCYGRSYDQRGLSFYRIDSSGAERIADVRKALSMRASVIFGMPVDRAFTEHRGADPISSIDLDEIVGGHMMTVLGHSSDGVLLDNWWGLDWGYFDGMGLMTDELFGSALLGDCYAILAAPFYS